jgi:2-iminobutanoate/2-iminopropanoate deaminase
MTEKREIIVSSKNTDMPFSTIVGFNKLVFVSGMVGRNPDTGDIAAADIGEQTRQTLTNIAVQLDLAGLSLENVLKATVFITDMGLFQEMNQTYKMFFETGLPARSCVQITALPDPEALVEIEVIAHR